MQDFYPQKKVKAKLQDDRNFLCQIREMQVTPLLMKNPITENSLQQTEVVRMIWLRLMKHKFIKSILKKEPDILVLPTTVSKGMELR